MNSETMNRFKLFVFILYSGWWRGGELFSNNNNFLSGWIID